MNSKWLEWARKIQAIAQNGLTYAQDVFDQQRYEELQNISAEIIEEYSNHTFTEIKDLFSKEFGYATPKVDVRGVVFRGDTILLVKEKGDNKWTLPGGWADVGESPSENVVREVYEESGYQTRAVRVLAVYDKSKHPHTPETPFHVYKLFFLCEIFGGVPRGGIETEDASFFRLDALPELSLSRVTAEQIARMYELRSELFTAFD